LVLTPTLESDGLSVIDVDTTSHHLTILKSLNLQTKLTGVRTIITNSSVLNATVQECSWLEHINPIKTQISEYKSLDVLVAAAEPVNHVKFSGLIANLKSTGGLIIRLVNLRVQMLNAMHDKFDYQEVAAQSARLNVLFAELGVLTQSIYELMLSVDFQIGFHP
jgi:hypothetical protein